MIQIKRMTSEDAVTYAQIAARAYREEPWNEDSDLEKLCSYCINFIASDTREGYLLVNDEENIGAALCILIPDMDGCYMRIEDFCILPCKQKQGFGTAFIKLLKKQAGTVGANSILLGTQRNFPAHQFYLKNGFEEIETSVLLYSEL